MGKIRKGGAASDWRQSTVITLADGLIVLAPPTIRAAMQHDAIIQLVTATFAELRTSDQNPSPARSLFGKDSLWAISFAAAIYVPCGLRTMA